MIKKVSIRHLYLTFITALIILVTTGCTTVFDWFVDESSSIAEFNKGLYLKSLEPYENNLEFDSKIIKESNGTISCVFFCDTTKRIYYAEKGSNELHYINTEDYSEKVLSLEKKYQDFNILSYSEYLIVVCDGESLYCISKNTDEILYHFKSKKRVFYSYMQIVDDNLFTFENKDTRSQNRFKATLFDLKGEKVIYNKGLGSNIGDKLSDFVINNGYFIYSFYGENLFARNINNYDLEWEYIEALSGHASEEIIISDNCIYKVIYNKLYSFNVENGNKSLVNGVDSIFKLCACDNKQLYLVSEKIQDYYNLNKVVIESADSVKEAWALTLHVNPYVNLSSRGLFIYGNSSSAVGDSIITVDSENGTVTADITVNNIIGISNYIKRLEEYGEYIIIELVSEEIYVIDKQSMRDVWRTYNPDKIFSLSWGLIGEKLYIFQNRNIIMAYDISN